MRIINGDCLEVLKTLPDNSVDSIITDPPYELGFMGKKWDNTGIAYNIELWKECLRVLKSGGHLLAFGGTRTYHRMAVAIEDAGFEVRDMIEWVYGSGFPKSLNIGKAVDKLGGRCLGQEKGTSEWEGWGTALKPAHEPICMARKPLSEKTVAENVLKHRTGGINIDESRVATDELTPRNNNNTETLLKKGFEGQAKTINPSLLGRFPANLIHDNSEEVRECFPDSKSSNAVRKNKVKTGLNGIYNEYEAQDSFGFKDSGNASRFFKSIIYTAKASKSERNMGCEGLNNEKFTAGNYSQSPVCKTCDKTLNGTNDHSKCSGEVYYREMKSKVTSNNHPTVKPVELMEYLINMVTPKRGTVLDPFMGSGTTGVASKNLSREFIGIELDPEYFKIAESRINNTTSQVRLDDLI